MAVIGTTVGVDADHVAGARGPGVLRGAGDAEGHVEVRSTVTGRPDLALVAVQPASVATRVARRPPRRRHGGQQVEGAGRARSSRR